MLTDAGTVLEAGEQLAGGHRRRPGDLGPSGHDGGPTAESVRPHGRRARRAADRPRPRWLPAPPPWPRPRATTGHRRGSPAGPRRPAAAAHHLQQTANQLPVIAGQLHATTSRWGIEGLLRAHARDLPAMEDMPEDRVRQVVAGQLVQAAHQDLAPLSAAVTRAGSLSTALAAELTRRPRACRPRSRGWPPTTPTASSTPHGRSPDDQRRPPRPAGAGRDPRPVRTRAAAQPRLRPGPLTPPTGRGPPPALPGRATAAGRSPYCPARCGVDFAWTKSRRNSALLRHRVQLGRVAHPAAQPASSSTAARTGRPGEAPGRDWLAGLEFRPWAIAPRV